MINTQKPAITRVFGFLDYLECDFRLDKKFNALVCKTIIGNQEIILLKPMSFMNLSGDPVQKALHFYKIPVSEMLVIHDELDFQAGLMKLKQGGGHAGHNGLRDIISKTGSNDFLRLRVGIDRPPHSGQVANYVLKQPSKADSQLIKDNFINAENAINILIKEDLSKAMLYLHS